MSEEFSPIFRQNRLDSEKQNYLYTKEYINFIISKFLYEKKEASYQEILDYLINRYDVTLMKISMVKKNIEGYFDNKKKGKFSLPDDKKENLMIAISLEKELYIVNKLSIEIKECSSYELFKNRLIDYLIRNIRENKMEVDLAQSILYNLLCELTNYYGFIALNIPYVNPVYKSMNINDIFEFTEIENDILLENQIISIEELLDCPIYFILIVFSLQLPNFINTLIEWKKSPEEIIAKSYDQINAKAFDILNKRNGNITNKKLSLEEIGTKYNLTRERVRQIESKAIQKITQNAHKIEPILKAIFYHETKTGEDYVTKSRLINKYSNDTANKILLLYEYGNLSLTYDSTYHIIYDKSINNIDKIVNNKIEEIGITVDYKETENADDFLQCILDIHYKKIQENLYIKKGFMVRDLYLDILEKYFPNGYKIGINGNYNELIQIAKDKYKIDEIPSEHSLEAMIGRSNFIQIDRGTYISEKYCIDLPNDLIDKILNYISENKFVYYRGIYEKFKKELSEIGINNHYYLKGCIDKKLPDNMVSKRDYIMNGNEGNTPYHELINLMRSYEGMFTLDNLRKRFIGLKDYSIYNALYNEIENGLIFISSEQFIYLNKLNLKKETINKLEQFIKDLFVSLNSKCLSSKKIYARLQIKEKELFKELNIINGHFHLFSLIRVLFPNYYYKRPFVSIENNQLYSNFSIIQNYAQKFDKFNKKMIEEYTQKMNLNGLYSYLQFMEDMSDDYVQIGVDTMQKKSCFNITVSELNHIKKAIDLIIKNFGNINTKQFKGYSLLPKIQYSWNKYLLVGIIRTFYSDEYEIINTTNTYLNTDFEVRRINHD